RLLLLGLLPDPGRRPVRDRHQRARLRPRRRHRAPGRSAEAATAARAPARRARKDAGTAGMTYHLAEIAAAPGSPLLFLLHGTGGDENDLIALGRQLMPDAHLIAPRGDVSEAGGSLRFFRRTGEGVYDMADLARATAKMGRFIAQHTERVQPPSVLAL